MTPLARKLSWYGYDSYGYNNNNNNNYGGEPAWQYSFHLPCN